MLMSGAAVNSVKRVGFFKFTIVECAYTLFQNGHYAEKKNCRKFDKNGVIRAKCHFHTVLHIPW